MKTSGSVNAELVRRSPYHLEASPLMTATGAFNSLAQALNGGLRHPVHAGEVVFQPNSTNIHAGIVFPETHLFALQEAVETGEISARFRKMTRGDFIQYLKSGRSRMPADMVIIVAKAYDENAPMIGYIGPKASEELRAKIAELNNIPAQDLELNGLDLRAV